MGKAIDLTGKVFGRLTVTGLSHKDKYRKIHWDLKCSCGELRKVSGSQLRSGRTKSCGCLRREISRLQLTKHGMSRAPTYKSWQHMLERCHNQKSQDYHRYGARGIKVCDRWKKFENFYEDMGEKPEGLTLERKDNSKGYFLNNCKWATRKEQARNRRNNHNITYRGETKTLAEWAEQYGIDQVALRKRLIRGWDIERALQAI